MHFEFQIEKKKIDKKVKPNLRTSLSLSIGSISPLLKQHASKEAQNQTNSPPLMSTKNKTNTSGEGGAE